MPRGRLLTATCALAGIGFIGWKRSALEPTAAGEGADNNKRESPGEHRGCDRVGAGDVAAVMSVIHNPRCGCGWERRSGATLLRSCQVKWNESFQQEE